MSLLEHEDLDEVFEGILTPILYNIWFGEINAKKQMKMD